MIIHWFIFTDSPTCANFELVPCGDPKGIFQWEFCSVTVAKQRITEVYLDIRYVNQRCQKVNFGITTNHQRFWVHQWCYGTFLVCFVPGKIFYTFIFSKWPIAFALQFLASRLKCSEHHIVPSGVSRNCIDKFGPWCDETCIRGSRQSKTQTSLFSYRD